MSFHLYFLKTLVFEILYSQQIFEINIASNFYNVPLHFQKFMKKKIK